MKNEIIDFFTNMKPFKDSESIPSPPSVDKDIYEKIIIPNYIRCGAIPKSELVVGGMYEGTCRNTNKAVWDGAKFAYFRTKFGHKYLDTVNHFEDDDGYDLFVPLRRCDKDIKNNL